MTDKTPNLGWPQDQRDLDAREALQAAAPSLPAGDGLTARKQALQEALAICEDEYRIRDTAGRTHPEDSPSRDRCFAAARAAWNCAAEIRSLLSAAPRQPGEVGAGVQCNHDMRWLGNGSPAQCQHCGKTASQIAAASAQQDERANCDGGQCGIGGYCKECPSQAQQDEPTPAQPISDAMMDLVDRLGSEAANVDPRAWRHLLVYAPKAAQQDERETRTLADWLKLAPATWDSEYANLWAQLQVAQERVMEYRARWKGAQQVQADAGAVAWIAEHENDELDFVNFHEEVARQQAEESGALRVRPLVYGDAYTRPAAESDKRDALPSVETLRKGFKTSRVCGPDDIYEINIKYRSIEDLHTAENELNALIRAAMSREQSGGGRG